MTEQEKARIVGKLSPAEQQQLEVALQQIDRAFAKAGAAKPKG